MSWDIRCCAYSTAANLTIIGAGIDQTVIGPSAYWSNNSLFSPQAVVLYGGGEYHIQDLTIRHCYDGLNVYGVLYLERCRISDNNHGIFWQSTGESGGWLRDCVIDGDSENYPTAIDLGAGAPSGDILMENCTIRKGEVIVRSVQNLNIVNCLITDYIVGLSLYGNARVLVSNSTITNMSASGVNMSMGSGAYCEIRDCDISGAQCALDTGSNNYLCSFAVFNSRLTGGSVAVFRARAKPAACQIHGCDLIKGSGPVVQCAYSYTSVTHDLTNNFWGTSSEAAIQSWIVDHSDDPSIPTTVLYLPFVGVPVPTELTTWGDLKAQYR